MCKQVWIALLMLPLLVASRASQAQSAAVTSVSLCQLMATPDVYDHQRISVSGRVSQGFEDFTISDPACPHTSIWLEYGGMLKSDTTYCCGPTNGRVRKTPMTVEGIVTTLVEDASFRAFDKQIHAGATSQAVIQGRFFAGSKKELQGGTFWTGFGHFGLYSLLVIEQVVASKEMPAPRRE